MIFLKRIISSNYIFYSLFFIFLFIFFTQIHPLVPFDSDDWEYLVTDRGFLPSLRNWNPSKVLPECLHAIVGFIAAFILNPIIHDYVTSIICTHSIVVSLFIIIYLLSAQNLIEWKFNISRICSHIIIIIFFILHFLILCTQTANNEYLFYSHDCTCYYHYIIPSLLCAALVMWLLTYNVNKIKQTYKISILAIVTYFALFSSLYSNIILVVFIGCQLLTNLISQFYHKQLKVSKFFKQHVYHFTVLALWFVVLWYEGNGRRGNSYGLLHAPLFLFIKQTILVFFHTRLNIKFVLLSVALLFVLRIYTCKKEKCKWYYIGKEQVILIASMILSTIYLILLSSRVDISYILRSDVIFSYAFFLLLLIILGYSYLCSNIKLIRVISPFVIFVLFFEINSNNQVFKDVQHEHGLNAQKCLSISKDLVHQVVLSDVAGKDTLVLNVPRFKEEDNWPLSIYTSENFGITLYKHGITKRKITTIFKTTR